MYPGDEHTCLGYGRGRWVLVCFVAYSPVEDGVLAHNVHVIQHTHNVSELFQQLVVLVALDLSSEHSSHIAHNTQHFNQQHLVHTVCTHKTAHVCGLDRKQGLVSIDTVYAWAVLLRTWMTSSSDSSSLLVVAKVDSTLW